MNAIIQSMRSVSSMRAIVLGVVGVVLLVVFGFLSLRLASPVYAPLYGNLSSDDAGAVVTELGAMGIPFQVAANGTQILVPSADVLPVRMALAQKGLPSQGSIVGYEIFDKSDSLGTSNFVHNVNLLRALEGELGRTISSFVSVKSARIHLVIPKRELFTKQRLEPSASVILTLNNRNKLPGEETRAIQHLVSTAVPGLKVSHITVVDSTGKLLARGVSEEDSGDMAVSVTNAQEYRVGYENRMQKSLESLLEESLGVDKVKVQVSADIAFDRFSSNSETYDPDGQVIRSIQSQSETEKSTEGGSSEVSVANNLPGGAAEGGTGAASNSERINETTNFEISKTVTNQVREVGTIKRISVAVLVDGTYKTEKDAEDNETTTYIPRTDEELEKIRTLVQSATGFDAKRGDTIEVINMQFNRTADNFLIEEGPLDWIKRDLDSILKTVVIGVVAILVILLVIRPLVNRAFEISAEDLQAEQSMAIAGDYPMAGGFDDEEQIDIDQIQNKVNASSVKKVNEFVEGNPEETLSVIRGWLSQK